MFKTDAVLPNQSYRPQFLILFMRVIFSPIQFAALICCRSPQTLLWTSRGRGGKRSREEPLNPALLPGRVMCNTLPEKREFCVNSLVWAMHTEKLCSKNRDKIWLTMISSACKSLPCLLHALTHFGEANEAGIHTANPPSPWRKEGQRSQHGKGSSEQGNISSTAANTVLVTALAKGVTLGIFCSSLTMDYTTLLQNELLTNTELK